MTLLDYSPRPARSRHAWRRWIVGPAAIVLILVAAIWGPRAWEHVRLLHWQERCAAWSRPKETLTYQQFVTGTSSPDWQQFRGRAGAGSSAPAALLFLHQLARADGQKRIVAVEIPIAPRNPCNYEIDWHVLAPGSMLARPRLLAAKTELFGWYITPTPHPESLRLYAGQTEPEDPGHFSIRFRYLGNKGVLDGRLTMQDTIELRVSNDEE